MTKKKNGVDELLVSWDHPQAEGISAVSEQYFKPQGGAPVRNR